MKPILSIILFCGWAFTTACTSSDPVGTDLPGADGPVRFSATISRNSPATRTPSKTPGGTRRGGDITWDLNKRNLKFEEGDVIWVANTNTAQRIPEFDKEDGNYFKYIYVKETETFSPSEEGQYSNYVKCEFAPYDGNGFQWSQLRLLGSSYRLEGAFYPGDYKHFEAVSPDQREPDEFKKNDLLLAHHLQPISQWGKEVHLRFQHVFSLIWLQLELPLYEDVNMTGFPEQTAPLSALANIQTAYDVNYSASISSDGMPDVNSTGEETEHLYMLYAGKDGEVQKEDGPWQTYHFLAIIPTPKQGSIANGTTFARFKLLNKEKTDTTDEQYGYYSYTPTQGSSINVKQGHVTQVQLRMKRDIHQPILIKAEIKPWTSSYSDIILDEETNDKTN